MEAFELLRYALTVADENPPVYTCLCCHRVSQVSNGTKGASVCRMMEKQLHFLHGRPRQAEQLVITPVYNRGVGS